MALAFVPSTASGQPQEHTVVVTDDPADWTPHVLDGRVNALLQIDDTVYAGGTFTQVSNADAPASITQPYLVAFDANTGVVDTGFAIELNGRVEALAASADGSALFAGGDFTRVDTTNVDRLV